MYTMIRKSLFLKKTLFLTSLSALVLMAGLSSAHAQTSRLYFAGYLGLSTFNNIEFTESTTPGNGDLNLDNSTSFAGALGIRLSRQIRVEAELSRSRADFDGISIAGVGSFDAGGDLQSTFAFLNLYYDFDVPWKIQPFIGGGLGYGWHSITVNDTSGTLPNGSSDEAALAWNAGGGIKYRPRTDFAFTAGYRYVDSLNLDAGSYELNYGSHEIRFGMEWDLPVK